MKVIVSQTKLNFVDTTADQETYFENLPAVYIVKPAPNGYTITAPKEKLFDLLYNLSCKYDVELV